MIYTIVALLGDCRSDVDSATFHCYNWSVLQPGAIQPSQVLSDRYQVLSLLGGGDATAVYKVRDIVNGRVLALKLLREDAPREAELRLSREFYFLSRFTHPGIVRALDYGSTVERRPYFTMEFYDGVPITSFFSKGYTPELVDVAVQILAALDSIHAQGLIHCDLKPQNILVNRNRGRPEARILDFGFAERVTFADAVVPRGTVGYVAPEVFKGIDADARADLYSLGLVLYEVMTGRGPGEKENLRQWLKMQYYSEFEPPRRFDASIPEKIEAVVMSLVRREPERRPRSAAVVIETLAGTRAPAGEDEGTAKCLMAPGFVGRSAELAALKELVDRAGQGRATAACVSGERGVGKTRLLSEFKFMVQLEGATIMAFEPVSLGARPQSLVEMVLGHPAVHPAAGLTGVDCGRAATLEESKYRLFETVTQRLKELCASDRVGHSLVLLVDDFELFDPTSLEFLRYLVLSLGTDMTLGAGRASRLMVLVAGLKEKRFLDLISDFSRRSCFCHLPMPPMERDEVKDLVVSLVGEMADLDTLVDWLVRTTGGNPLFVIETVHSLIEGRILLIRGSRWAVAAAALDAYRPPNTVTEVVCRRLENLSTEEMEVIEIGATATGPFTLGFLRAVLGHDEKVLFNAVAGLKVLGLLRSFAGEDGPGFILSSKILEAAVTERLTEARRRENHRRVALALESLYPDKQDRLVFDLAHHYAQAGIRDRAYAYSVRAGCRARDYRLSEQALGCFETALAFSDQTASPRERALLMETVGELRAATGRFASAIDIYTRGMAIVRADSELSGDRQLLSRLLGKMGHVRQEQGQHKEAVDFFNQALLMQPDENSPAYVNILDDLGWSYCSANDFGRAEELLTRALLLAEKPGQDPRVRDELSARTLYYLSVLAWSRYDFVLALQLAERALRTYEAIRDDYYISKVSQLIATLWWRRGELEQARDCYQRCLALQRKSGHVRSLFRSLQGLGVIAQDAGEWHKAYDYFAEALSLAERIGDVTAMADLSANLGMTADERGDWDQTLACLTRALKLHERVKADSYGRRIVLANLAHLRDRQGESDEAERLFKEASALDQDSQDPDFRYNLAAYQVEFLLRRERLQDARKTLASAFLLVRREKDPRKLARLFTLASGLRIGSGDASRAAGDARRALLLLGKRASSKEYAVALRYSGLAKSLSDRPERGTQEIRRSIDLLRDMRQRHELALSLMASAQALTRQSRGGPAADLMTPLALGPIPQRDLDSALADLKEAQSIFRAIGARPDEKKADDLLETITQLSATMQLKTRERGEYLEIFHRLSELISMDLDKDDFCERVLDLVIEVTRAERGLLFIVQDDKLVPAAGRDVDRTTMADAEAVSHTVLRRVKRRGEMVFSADALSDPRFNAANSVVLNKIRSMLCVPLVVPWPDGDSLNARRTYERVKVIGTIYVDSRITTHLFLEDDKSLLASVANLLAATIDKSLAFIKLQEELVSLRQDAPVDPATGCLLGKSRAIRDVYRVIDKIAPIDCTVLLTGETGTGKGVLARLIHSKSERRGDRFVSINCGTLPENLFESELFGHTRGAFTGATRDKEGLFETAEGGTVFLDEIGNTTLNIQAKLLQVIEEKVIRRVGETLTRKVDVRLMCATNRRLEEDIRAGTFRQDLYYRLNIVTINAPPLRERAIDIPLLANHFLKHYASGLNKRVTGFDEDVLATLAAHDWPGNVRELQNAIERAVIMTQKRRIASCDMASQIPMVEPESKPETEKRGRVGRNEVISALKETHGNVSRAAELLAIHRRQLQRLIQRYRIDRTVLQGPPRPTTII